MPAIATSASYFQPPQQLQSSHASGDSGFSVFGWHPHLPNLGGITAIKQFASGITGLIETPFRVASGDESIGDAASGLAKGFAGGLFDVAATAGRVVGVPGTDISLEKPIQALGKSVTGMTPEDVFTASRREGPIAAITSQLLSVAAVAAPVAGVLGKAAGAAEEAASLAEQAAKAAEGTGEAAAAQEAAATQAARAAELARHADIAHQFSHPFGYLGGKFAELTAGAREQVFPAVSETEASTPLPHEVVQQMADGVRATLNPQEAAATSAARSPLEEAAIAAARAEEANPTHLGATNEELLSQHAGSPTKTLYRGEPAGVEGGARGTNFSENPAYAKGFAGEDGTLYKVEVPVDEAGVPRVGERAAVENTGHVLPGDWADAAKPIEDKVVEPKVPKTPSTIEDINGANDERAGQLATTADEAAAASRESSVADAVGKRLSLPAPAWARRITAALPDSVNRVLAYMNTPIDRMRLHNVFRDYARMAEVSQRVARQSAAVVAGRTAALDILNAVPDLTRFDLTRMVGEEIGARMDGTALVDAMVKETAGNASPALVESLRNMARRGYTGISDEVLGKLSDEQRTALEGHLDEAVSAWRDESRKRLDTLLASSKGTQGLEKAVLDDAAPTMTPNQVKAYRRAMNDLRRAAQLRERIPDQLGALQATAERADLFGAKAARGAETARKLVGIAMRTADSLHDGIPAGIAALDKTIDEIKSGIANGGITYDVGLGREAAAVERGFTVGIAPQFDVPMEEFMARGNDLIRQAVTNPTDIDGNEYGLSIWAGKDARLGAWVHTGSDGRQYVAADISIGTWGDKPLQQWQATVLGETFHQEATWDSAAAAEVHMTQQPDVQNLMAHYASDALNKRSELYRFAEQLRKASEGAPGISAADIDAQLRMYMTWDYALTRSDPDTWKQGDYFKAANVDFGKAAPTSPGALAQTSLGLSSAKDGVEAAFATLEHRTVSDALAWYYDGHDYIESSWRGQEFPHLNGTTRDAADVFYDLVAVTSQMASPKQNLGRALMGFSNMEDFLKARRGAMDSVTKLLDRLQKLPEKSRFNDKVVQRLIEKTGMVGNTKRLAFDVISGRLNLETASEAEIGAQPEFWGSPGKSLSEKNVPEGMSPMEYHGSMALAKMRSFRDNLAHPHTSLAVTLDSVMSRMYGFRGTDWALKGNYAKYADDIRDAAKMLSEKMGREVKPHEVQALLWVYTKQEIGRQDWGRLLAHHDMGLRSLDAMQQMIEAKQPINPRDFDPLNDYFNEELGYSRARMEQQIRFSSLQKQVRKYGVESLHPKDVALYEAGVDQGIKRSTVEVAADRTDLAAVPHESGVFQDRYHIPYDAQSLTVQEQRYRNYLGVRDDIQQALHEGDVPEARRLLTSYVAGQRRGIQGDVGGSFQKVGEETRAAENDSAAIAEKRLARAKSVPAPRSWAQNFISPLAARFNRENGLAAPTAINTLAQVVPERTAEVAQAVQDIIDREAKGEITPAERAAQAGSYKVLQQWIDKQYEYMTNTLGLKVDYVRPDQEYGIGTLGDSPQPESVAAAHAALVHDVRANNHLAVRGTALAGDGPNEFMGQMAPDGIMYNDKLRAVHDFYGHTQAANDFSRHGENIAQMLHLQMFPEEAWPALFTEFRAQTAYLVDRGTFLDNQLTASLPDAMRQPDYLLRGSSDELHQRFMGNLRGATITPPGQDGRLTMRLFHDAAIDTLAHEGAHLLRQMLPTEDMAWVRRTYPHIDDAVLTDARRASEERFVSDMMLHIRGVVHGTEDQGQLADTFRRIAATMEEQHAAWLDSVSGRSATPDVASFWSRMFHPDIEAPDTYADPISTQRVAPGGVEVKQFRWESDAQFAQRARQYGEARQSVETARVRAQQAAQRAAKADSASRSLWAALQEPTRAEVTAAALQGRAGATLERLGAQLEDPSTGQVPAAWQPLWDDFRSLRAEAIADTTGQIAQALGEIPERFSQVLQFAADRGFDPTHVNDMTWEKAQRYLFGHITLGSHEETSGLRTERTGALNRAGIADRSLEALGAGIVDANKELYTNKAVAWVEQYYSQPYTAGAAIPDGWEAWDPTRKWMMTGEKPSGKTVAPNATRIIPKHVGDALRNMGKSYDHWAFHMVTRVTSPWRTLILSMSPAWYIKHAVGSIVLSAAEGVRITDWMKSFREWKTNMLPEDVRSIHSFAQSTEAEGASSLIPRSVRSAKSAEGLSSAAHEVQSRLFRVNNAMNEIARGAVYDKMLRTGFSREAALTRAYTALGDYGDLTPFERSAIRSVIPFYTFQKAMLKLVMRFPADHPLGSAVMMQLGAIHEEMMQDKLGGTIPDAYFGLANLGGFGYRNVAFANPFKDPYQLLTPAGIAASFNPFLDMLARDAYNAPSPGAAQQGVGPTGRSQEQVNLAAEFGSQMAGLPQIRLAQQVAGGGDIYGQDPGTAGAVAQYFGNPRSYSPGDIAAIAARVRKTLGEPAAPTNG